MKLFLRKIIDRIKRYCGLLLIRIGFTKPYVVILLDGGICSQMHQYLLGRLFTAKGYSVVYDLCFFKNGKDLNGIFERNFDLLKAFPYLEFEALSKRDKFIYWNCFYYFEDYYNHKIDHYSYLSLTPPVYLNGYYHSPNFLWKSLYKDYYNMDTSILDGDNQKMYNDIVGKHNSVAVHVRRGDLKNDNPVYGTPASIQYFKDAVNYINSQVNEPYYYFFSDEPDWVDEELIPTIALRSNYQIVTVNGSDKGYMDLFLIATCKHQITSKGSLGKYGALMFDNEQKIVTLCNDPIEYPWKERLINTVYL